MSCEGHRDKFFDLVCQEDKVQAALGSPEQAHAVLDQVFQLARVQSPRSPTREQAARAEAGCRALFAQFQAAGIKPPSHSVSGLPRRDAQFGYDAVDRTLRAVRQNKPLPGLAQEVLAKSGHRRAFSAVGQDAHGILRCASCGRFASPTKGHICPITATKDSLNRALVRRLGVPESAFGGGNALDALLADARQQGSLRLRHSLTGEVIQASLDGLPLALATGFVPEAWRGQSQAVELADGRVVSVLDPSGLQPVTPPAGATAAAAQAYGLSLPENTPVASAASLPPVAYRRTREASSTSVSGGVAYDMPHFIGTEYRKGGSHGAEVSVYGTTYVVGQRSQEQSDWSTARLSGQEPPPKGGVAVGRTLVEAMRILAAGEVVETADGLIQVQEAGRRALLSVYDPNTGTAGDVAGTPNASAAQLAALIAQRALHPENAFDAALALDLARMHEGAGTPLAAADSAYIAIKNGLLAEGQTITLGGTVSAPRCPQCGQFMGEAHVCPVGEKPEETSGSFQKVPEVSGNIPEISGGFPEIPPQRLQVDVNVDASVDGAAIAEALRSAPPQPVEVQAAFDAQAFARALKEELATLSPAAPAAVQAQGVDELRQAVAQMTEAVQSLAQVKVAEPSASEEALLSAVDRLASAFEERPAAPIPVPAPKVAKPAPKPAPKPPAPRREPSAEEERTPQEKILLAVRLPAPDPFLKNAPPSVTGGGLLEPLDEFIPSIDPNFEINEQTRSILHAMAALLQIGAGKPKNAWSRSFGIYGPPGTGKNTLARQLAASIQTVDAEGKVSQGMNYVEANITPESSMQELIGTTVIAKDPETGATISRAQLGKIGLAAAMGSVICINEIVRSPKLATALQSMIEDGEIQIDSPEQGLVRIPVHPSTVFVCTWNPGYEGDAERPGMAPLSRMMTRRLERASPEEQARRVEAFFATLSGTMASSDAMQASRQSILTQDYAIPADIAPSPEEVNASVRFFNEIALLSGGGVGGRQIGLNSETPTMPGPRELNRFIALGKAVGWEDALETLKICCDQDDQFESQWALVRERFEAHFGADGGALGRPAPEQA